MKNSAILILTITMHSLFPFSAKGETTSTDFETPGARIFILTGQSNAGGRAAWKDVDLPPMGFDNNVRYFYDTDTTGAFKGMESSEGEFVAIGPAPNGRFGPELGVSRQLSELGVDDQVIIKFSRGGTNLSSDWKPGAAEGKILYAELLENISQVTDLLQKEGVSYKIEGLFWMQGESDSGAASSYGRNLQNLIASLRRDLQAPGLPVVIGRVAPNDTERRETVRQAQAEVAEADPLADWVDTDDLTRFDGIHFDASSTLTLGQRMADAWHKLAR